MNHQKFIRKMTKKFLDYLETQGEIPMAEKSKLARGIFDSIAETAAGDADTFYIEAPNAVAEVIDEKTGRIYRRYLELEFDENNNGIRICGEDMSGNPVQIVFLSGGAIEKIQDIHGQGRDDPRCDDTGEHNAHNPVS